MMGDKILAKESAKNLGSVVVALSRPKLTKIVTVDWLISLIDAPENE